MSDIAEFARLVRALQPWHAQLVFVGGWAHRLYRLHPLAGSASHLPLATRDADVAFANEAKLDGDISKALIEAGFREELSGEHRPPVTQYTLGDESKGFYAEFLTPLRGSGVRRDGRLDATVGVAGVTAQKLRHLDILLIEPWLITLKPDEGLAITEPVELRLANPTSFIVQKLLIREDRRPEKRAQDVLYIYDTLALFGAQLDGLAALWQQSVRPALTPKQIRSVQDCINSYLRGVNDTFRDAARIPQDRTLDPSRMQAFCEQALDEILRT